MKKSSKKIIGIVAVFIVVIILASNGLPNTQVSTTIQDGINIADYFAPFSTLDLATPAPAISCSLTNNAHLIGADGSSYTINSASGTFQPAYNSLINPYNGKTPASQDVKVYIYCNPSSNTYSSIGYYPYLTGGSIQIQFNGKDSAGYQRPLQTFTLQVSPMDASGNPLSLPVNLSGKSILIAKASIPISTISQTIQPTTTDFYSQQQIITTGTLNFKEKLSNSISATHQISPLYTSFSYLVQATQKAAPTCTVGNVLINNVCTSITQSLLILPTSYDKIKADSIVYTISVSGWSSTQSYPVVKLSSINSAGAPTLIKTININNPPKSILGTTAFWEGVISIKNDLGGKTGNYALTLQPNIVGSYTRLPASQDFTVFDSTVKSSSASNPTPPAATSSSGTGTLQFLYNVKYDSGYEDLGTAPKNGFPITFTKQNLIATSTSGKMISFTLSTQMTVDDQKFANLNIVSSKLTHTGTISVQGYGTIPLSDTELSGAGVKVNGRQSSGQAAIYTFDNISVDPLLIDGKISQLAPAQIFSSIPVNIEIDTSGTFVMADSNGNQYNGVISGAVFTYGTNFGTVVTNPIICTADQLSIGFTAVNNQCVPPASTSNVCTASQSAAGYTISNGICTAPSGSTTNTCTDSSGNAITCPPTSSPTPFCQLNPNSPACDTSGHQLGGNSNGTSGSGMAGICPSGTSLQDCLSAIAAAVSNINNSSPTTILNNNIYVDLLIIIAVVITIVVLFKRKK